MPSDNESDTEVDYGYEVAEPDVKGDGRKGIEQGTTKDMLGELYNIEKALKRPPDNKTKDDMEIDHSTS